MPPRISLLLIPLAILSAPTPARAQYPARSVHVDWAPAAPTITRVALRNDSAFFSDPDAVDGSAYVFDRRARTLARVRAPADLPEPFNSRQFVDEAVPLVDSLVLVTVALPDGSRSHVVRIAGNRNIALRGVRVAAEQRSRRARGLSPTPVNLNEANRYAKEDWSPIDVMSFAVDSAAIWLGLYSPPEYQDFALGGLLRIDRRTHEVVVVSDTSLMHATVGQIVADGKNGYLLRVDGTIARFDTATRRSQRVDVGVYEVQRFALASDTLFIAGAWAIAVADLRNGSVVSRGFELKMVGDSAVYALADSTVQPSLNFRAALGIARRFPIAPLGAWMRAALPAVKPVSIEYYFPGDRQMVHLGVDSTDTTSERSVYRDEDLEGPTGLYVDSLTHPSLRPFLREATRRGDMYIRLELADLLLAASDTAAVPYLRVVLDSTPYPYSSKVAVALALLGDSTGHRWIRRALVDTLRPSASMDPTRPIHHNVFNAAMSVMDPANVPRLVELLADHRYSRGAAEILLAYRSAAVLQRALIAADQASDHTGLRDLLSIMAVDTSAVVSAPAVRDPARAIGRRLILGGPPGLEVQGATILARYALVDDLPFLINALARDSAAYSAAVVALVRLAGTGVEAMPVGVGTPTSRAEARQWWMSWYARSRADFRPASKDAGERAAILMGDKLRRRPEG